MEVWTEEDVYNWIASSSRLTLVPVNQLPFDQFQNVTGKQLVKWKVSNFVQKDSKNGVFLYLYLQDIIAHHKGKACRNEREYQLTFIISFSHIKHEKIDTKVSLVLVFHYIFTFHS